MNENMIRNIAFIFPYILIFSWLVFSVYYLYSAKIRKRSVNPYILDSIPSVFTTLGVLGTFTGIAVGLIYFNVDDITASIPQLLDGLKVAFFTSILGITLSLITGRFVEYIQAGRFDSPEVQSELDALKRIIELLDENDSENKGRLDMQVLKEIITGDRNTSVSGEFERSRMLVREELTSLRHSIQSLELTIREKSDVQSSETGELKNILIDSRDILKTVSSNTLNTENAVRENTDVISERMATFNEALQKTNTDALVKAIENVIGGFNDKLSDLIDRLVKENFEQLNESIVNLNEWQKENRDQVDYLISRFRDMTGDFENTSESLKTIAESSRRLTSDNSILFKIIKELEEITVNNHNFRDSIDMLKKSAYELKDSSEKMHDSGNILNDWMKKEKRFAESVNTLVDKLREIELLRDRAGDFWADIHKNMNRTISTLDDGNDRLYSQLKAMEESFRQRMEVTFSTLDSLLQAMVMDYADTIRSLIKPDKDDVSQT